MWIGMSPWPWRRIAHPLRRSAETSRSSWFSIVTAQYRGAIGRSPEMCTLSSMVVLSCSTHPYSYIHTYTHNGISSCDGDERSSSSAVLQRGATKSSNFSSLSSVCGVLSPMTYHILTGFAVNYIATLLLQDARSETSRAELIELTKRHCKSCITTTKGRIQEVVQMRSTQQSREVAALIFKVYRHEC
ncbi:hypothetical protein F5Y09DRAFT_257895 [Xylaria sp. FL1042]|nr:hypothetical protein F5Y09DRAFT_257895 [Xylaria sp. FL1042]